MDTKILLATTTIIALAGCNASVTDNQAAPDVITSAVTATPAEVTPESAPSPTPTPTPVYYDLKGTGTAADPYLIETIDDLKQIHFHSVSVFSLVNDLDLGGENWTPIADEGPLGPNERPDNPKTEFTGTFDGNGHKITGLYIKNSELQNVGFFGINAGTIKNLTVTGNIYASGKQMAGMIYGSALSLDGAWVCRAFGVVTLSDQAVTRNGAAGPSGNSLYLPSWGGTIVHE
jgi:hypothetical protein